MRAKLISLFTLHFSPSSLLIFQFFPCVINALLNERNWQSAFCVCASAVLCNWTMNFFLLYSCCSYAFYSYKCRKKNITTTCCQFKVLVENLEDLLPWHLSNDLQWMKVQSFYIKNNKSMKATRVARNYHQGSQKSPTWHQQGICHCNIDVAVPNDYVVQLELISKGA